MDYALIGNYALVGIVSMLTSAFVTGLFFMPTWYRHGLNDGEDGHPFARSIFWPGVWPMVAAYRLGVSRARRSSQGDS